MGKSEPKKGGPGVRVNVAAIKAARESKGWSQKTLAQEIGCDSRVIERVESRGTAALKTIADIAEVLKVAPESLRQPASESPAYSRGVFQLPPPLPDFTGREDELARITARLRGAGGTVGVSSALRGMGGIGKTVTAIEACWDVKDNFPDGQLVVELRGMSEQPLTPVQAMSQIIRAFHPETDKLPDDEKELLPLYRRILTGKQALILLDDAKDKVQVESLLSVPPVAFVVTSRNTLALNGVESIRLGVLPPDEALALLRSIVGTNGTDDELQTVTKQCGWLPLALRVAGDFLRLHENWSLSEYIDALRDESKRLEYLERNIDDRDVEAVLALSARELVRENPIRAARWQMLSVFPADFNGLAAAAVWDLKTGDAPDAGAAKKELTALLERSLVQHDTGTGRYSLHDLMRPIAREMFASKPTPHGIAADCIYAAEQRFTYFFLGVLAVANQYYLKGGINILNGLTLFDYEEANIRHGQAWAAQHLASDPVVAEWCRDYSGAGTHIINLRLPATDQVTWFENAIEACRKIGDRRGEGNALNHLGVAQRAIGNMQEAIAFHNQALAIARSPEIKDRSEEGAALGNLGSTWLALEDANQAITFYQQRLVIAREIGDRRGESNALGNLGSAWFALEDANQAITFYQQMLAITREIKDRHAEACASFNMAQVLYYFGRHDKAMRLAEYALALCTAIESPRAEMVRQALAEWRGESAT